MTKEEIIQIDKYFTCYSTGPYHSAFYYPKPEESRQICRKLLHKECDNFHLIIFDDTLEVYQANTDHEIYGIELETFKDLRVRFESFTGEKIYDIRDAKLESDMINARIEIEEKRIQDKNN
jgi:hypothetical protein